MQVTATVNVDSKQGWSSVKKHVEHDPNIEHKNQDIAFDYRSLNRHGQLANVDKILNAHYGKMVKEHDEKVQKQGHKNRVYGSVSKMLVQKSGHYDERLVATFGDKDTKDNLIKAFQTAYPGDDPETIKRTVLRTCSTGLASYARGFNKRNKCLTMTQFRTNVDELGAPHVHAQVIPRGHTKTGKASGNMNMALREQYGFDPDPKKGPSNRVTMAKWRQQEDEALVRNVERAFIKSVGKTAYKNVVGSLDLMRTGKPGGIDMATYKNTKKALDKDIRKHDNQVATAKGQVTKLRKQRTQLKRENTKLADQNDALRESVGNYQNKKDELKRLHAKVTDQTMAADDRELKINAREKQVASRERDLNETVETGLRVVYPDGLHYHDSPADAIPDIAAGKAHMKTPQGSLSGVALLINRIHLATLQTLRKLEERFKKQEQERHEQQAKDQKQQRSQADSEQNQDSSDDDVDLSR